MKRSRRTDRLRKRGVAPKDVARPGEQIAGLSREQVNRLPLVRRQHPRGLVADMINGIEQRLDEPAAMLERLSQDKSCDDLPTLVVPGLEPLAVPRLLVVRIHWLEREPGEITVRFAARYPIALHTLIDAIPHPTIGGSPVRAIRVRGGYPGEHARLDSIEQHRVTRTKTRFRS